MSCIDMKKLLTHSRIGRVEFLIQHRLNRNVVDRDGLSLGFPEGVQAAPGDLSTREVAVSAGSSVTVTYKPFSSYTLTSISTTAKMRPARLRKKGQQT
jgi:hypothetical protein